MGDFKKIMETPKLKFWERKSKILDKIIPFYIKGFYNDDVTGYTLALEEIDCNEWFRKFIQVLTNHNERGFLPVCRLSDGEYTFICGNQPPMEKKNLFQIFSILKYYLNKLKPIRDFEAFTSGIYHSGAYSRNEIKEFLPNYLQNLKQISEAGILALHLTYSVKPFQERFHFALKKVFNHYDIKITNQNYYPFYFVYAFFHTEEFFNAIKKKNILIITGANKEKIDKVRNYFNGLEVNNIEFLKISAKRSLFDKIDLKSLETQQVDFCFIAAGIGKPNIMVQLKPLNCICIDVGYIFEVWVNSELGYKRPWGSKNHKIYLK